jgi:peptidoglycan hydrolase-like protein with peptidoglycan-binding domain
MVRASSPGLTVAVAIFMKNSRAILSLLLLTAVSAGCSDATDGDAYDEDAPAGGPLAGQTLTWPLVGNGDAGDLVAAVQFLLISRGQSVVADGSFGAGTEAAVISFQRSNRLVADGLVGGGTWEALISDVKPGNFGAAVQAAQQLLVRSGRPVAVDGDAGNGTVNAITSFQRSKCLGTTGVVGRFTWNSLISGRDYCTPQPQPGGSDFCQFSWEEKPGTADYTTINWFERSLGNERARNFDRTQANTLQGSGRLGGDMCANARLLKTCFDKAVARERSKGSAFLTFVAARGLDPARVKMAFSFQETFLGQLHDDCVSGSCNGVGIAQIITAYPNDNDFSTTLGSSDARWDGISYNVLTNLAYSSRVLSEKVVSFSPPNLVELARAYNGNPDANIRLPYGTNVQRWYNELGSCGL